MANVKSSAKDIEEGKIVAILAYIVWLVGIIWYFADDKMKKNNFAKFHVKQSIILVISAVVIWIAVGILSFIFVLTIFLAFLAVLLWIAAWILIVLWVILGLVHAINGEEKELFLIGGLAKHLTF